MALYLLPNANYMAFYGLNSLCFAMFDLINDFKNKMREEAHDFDLYIALDFNVFKLIALIIIIVLQKYRKVFSSLNA